MFSADQQPSFIKSTVSQIKTKAGYNQANHLWMINDYRSIHCGRRVKLNSQPFSADDVFKWQLVLDPNRPNTSISLGFKIYEDLYIESKHYPVTGKFTASIIDVENRAEITKSTTFTISNTVLYQSKNIISFDDFFGNNNLFAARNKLLPQDRLTIFGEVMYIKQSDIVNASGRSFSCSPLKIKKSQSTGLEDFEKLLKDEEFADITLRVNGKNHRAHKNILAARSPVFKAMLTVDMIEKRTNRIEINNMGELVFIEMLRYMYTGKPQNLTKKILAGLLEAAEIYDLKQLKVICVEELIKKLSRNNVKDILSLADKYNSTDLKTAATQFSKVNFINFQGTNKSFVEIKEYLASWMSHPLGYICVFWIFALFIYILFDFVPFWMLFNLGYICLLLILAFFFLSLLANF